MSGLVDEVDDTTTSTTTGLTVGRVLDDFVVIIGAQRSGSTLLHSLLDGHPAISMIKPVRPEPKIFLDPHLTAQALGEWLYGRLSTLDPDATVYGEKSTSYLETPHSAATIDLLVPRSRVVAVARNPIDRAVSNHRFSVANGFETADLETALSRELDGDPPPTLPEGKQPVSASPFAYLDRGRYHHHLQPYDTVFGPDRLRVVMLEELIDGPEPLADLYRWLGVDPDHRPRLDRPVNAGSGEQHPLSPRLRSRLGDHFAAANQALAERYHLDVGRWG